MIRKFTKQEQVEINIRIILEPLIQALEAHPDEPIARKMFEIMVEDYIPDSSYVSGLIDGLIYTGLIKSTTTFTDDGEEYLYIK